mmetsp:Transcript_14012/g.42316  ORF Transcript_14012/g.42316 Transcript_14012/m.42316 type:complete len:214 (+) Transcript_14012:588-1229(+)
MGPSCGHCHAPGSSSADVAAAAAADPAGAASCGCGCCCCCSACDVVITCVCTCACGCAGGRDGGCGCACGRGCGWDCACGCGSGCGNRGRRGCACDLWAWCCCAAAVCMPRRPPGQVVAMVAATAAYEGGSAPYRIMDRSSGRPRWKQGWLNTTGTGRAAFLRYPGTMNRLSAAVRLKLASLSWPKYRGRTSCSRADLSQISMASPEADHLTM